MKRILSFYYRLTIWIFRYPTKGFGRRLKILFDYLHLHRTKGLNMDEYYEFEFEKRSEEFRNFSNASFTNFRKRNVQLC